MLSQCPAGLTQLKKATTMSNLLKTLKIARKAITNPKRWTIGANARDRNLDVVSPTSSKACQRCAYGAAIYAAAKVTDTWDRYDLAKDATEYLGAACEIVTADLAVPRRSIISVNDELGHDMVLRVYDFCIDRIEEIELSQIAQGNLENEAMF